MWSHVDNFDVLVGLCLLFWFVGAFYRPKGGDLE